MKGITLVIEIKRIRKSQTKNANFDASFSFFAPSTNIEDRAGPWKIHPREADSGLYLFSYFFTVEIHFCLNRLPVKNRGRDLTNHISPRRRPIVMAPPTLATSSPLTTLINSDVPSSVPSFSRPVPSNLHAKTARTYGKPKALIPATPDTSSDTAVQEASSSQTFGQDGRGEEEIEVPQPIGRDSSYTIIPETEFEHPEAENDTPKASVVRIKSRQDRIDEGEEVDEIVDEGLLRREDTIASSPGSASTSPPRNQNFSTDPTTEEEDLESPSRKTPRASSSIQASTRRPVVEESDASEDDAEAAVAPRETAAEMMARIDRELDEVEKAAVSVPQGLVRLLPVVATSSLTSLESSNLPTSPDTLAFSSRPILATTQHTPLAQSARPHSHRSVTSPASEGSGNIVRQPIQKKRKRIIESDVESEDEQRLQSARQSSPDSSTEGTAAASTSKGHGAQVSPIITNLSKKERLEALARRRAPLPVPEEVEVARAPMDVSSEEEQEKADKKSKKRKVGSASSQSYRTLLIIVSVGCAFKESTDRTGLHYCCPDEK